MVRVFLSFCYNTLTWPLIVYSNMHDPVPIVSYRSDIQEWKELPPAASLVETRYKKLYNKYIKKSANMPVFVSDEAKHQAVLCLNNEKRPYTFELIETEVSICHHVLFLCLAKSAIDTYRHSRLCTPTGLAFSADRPSTKVYGVRTLHHLIRDGEA